MNQLSESDPTLMRKSLNLSNFNLDPLQVSMLKVVFTPFSIDSSRINEKPMFIRCLLKQTIFAYIYLNA